MAKAESRRSSALLLSCKSGAEEQLNGAAELTAPGARTTKPASTRETPGRRTTESEVFDDGTNTFFW